VVLFVAIFSLPQGLGQVGLFAWLTLLSVLLRISTSLFILPYQAIGAELSDDYTERSGIVAWRWGIGMLGTLAAVLLGFGVFFAGPGGLARRAAYTPFALSLSVIVIIGGVLSIRSVLATRDRLHPPVASEHGFQRRLIAELGEVFRNRSFRILFIGALLFFTALGTHMALGLHANTYFWRLSAAQTQGVTLAVFAGLLFGAPIAAPLLKVLEKRTLLIVGMAGLGAADCLPTALRLAGVFPFEGATLATILSILVFFGGMLMAAAAIAFGSMMADAADEHEHLFGARREGLYFAGWAFASKAATGAGALIAGLVLQAIAFPTDIAQHGGMAAALPERTAHLLGLFYGPGAGLLYIGAILTTWLYRLDASSHSAIMHDLNERRVVAASVAAALAP
jgi:GPH family glycoside/pentoside/hexuronide:cation symporter